MNSSSDIAYLPLNLFLVKTSPRVLVEEDKDLKDKPELETSLQGSKTDLEK